MTTNLIAFRKYQLESAWTWEHQALLRARPVAELGLLSDAFRELRTEIIRQPRDEDTLRSEITQMRERMLREQAGLDEMSLKQGRGGLIDIEFISQFLALAHSRDHRILATAASTRDTLQLAARCGVLESQWAKELSSAYQALLAADRLRTLTGKPPRGIQELLSEHSATVTRVWRHYLEP